MAFDLHLHPMSPGCQSVMVLAKHIGIDFNIKEVDLFKGEHLSDEFIKINPYHMVPTLVDGDFVLWESRAIMQYLCNRYAPNSSLYPRDPKKRATVDMILDIDVSYFHAIHEILACHLKEMEVTQHMNESYHKNLKMMDTMIGNKKFLVGNQLTIADLSVAFSTSMLAMIQFKETTDYKNLLNWFENIKKQVNHVKDSLDTANKLLEKMRAEKKFPKPE